MSSSSGERVLITGHTGFKGSWLTHLLAYRGFEVAGYSLSTSPGFHYLSNHSAELLAKEYFGDVRDTDELSKALKNFRPDVVVHLAAQALVSNSFSSPFLTISSNVEGTNAVLEVAIQAKVPKILIITTDKVYAQDGRELAKTETDALGGYDPYSASKAAADLVTQAWMNLQMDSSSIHVARGGNVIGGGDRGLDRLLPDFERSLETNSTLQIRSPKSVRPWQHVLDCLSGYWTIVESMCAGESEVWNVGPDQDSKGFLGVNEVIRHYSVARGKEPKIEYVNPKFKETRFLAIDSTKLKQKLGWVPRLDSIQAIRWTAHWEKTKIRLPGMAREATTNQIQEFHRL